MNYPLISVHIEAIKAAEDNFEQLKNLRPILDRNGANMKTAKLITPCGKGKTGVIRVIE